MITVVVKRIAMGIVISGIILLFFEAMFRITRIAPSGRFDFLEPTRKLGGLYEPNREIKAGYGPLPYTIRTNSLGLRGTGVPGVRPLASRIVAIGDSSTDGFYVDNEGTFPYLLQKISR